MRVVAVPCSNTRGCDDRAARRHIYSLRCDPAAGTMPDASAACAALADLQHRRQVGAVCFGEEGTGFISSSQISGRYDGVTLELDLNPEESWCDETRPVMRDYWAISGFPCWVAILHTSGGPMNYSRWARWAGCQIDKTAA